MLFVRASIYAYSNKGRWLAAVTIAPEVDLAYRLDADWRAGVYEALAERMPGAASRFAGADALSAAVLLLAEPLPLGDAFEAAARFAARAKRLAGETAAARLLRACAREAAPRAARGRADAQPAAAVHRHARVPASAHDGAARAEARALAAAALSAAAALQGRALLRGEAQALLGAAGWGASGPGQAAGRSGRLPASPADWGWLHRPLQLAALLGRLRLGAAVARVPGRGRRGCRCLRCGSGEAHLRRTPCAACGRVCAYCEACLLLGRCRECELLVTGMPAGANVPSAIRARALPSVHDRLAGWGLTPAQYAAAEAALQYLENAAEGGEEKRGERRMIFIRDRVRTRRKPPFLFWAVTGAGKTEMMFPLIESALLRGGKVMVATPRRDVVLELEPRIKRAFPAYTVTALHGESQDKWTQADITVATTHQTMRFAGCFALVVIDELDAYPYHNNPMLQYAAEQCGAPHGGRVLLTATPPASVRREADRGRLPHARIPVRYHGCPLPVPQLLRLPTVRELIRRGRLPAKLTACIAASLARGAQVFVFVARIQDAAPLAAMLRSACPRDIAIGDTSSKDAGRTETVRRFRDRELRLLVTTTILERGVTIPRSDVFVLDADAPLFDEASLVQMAGRAGRSADDPFGRVYYCGTAITRAQRTAVRQIRAMNRLAARHGYLKEHAASGRGRRSAWKGRLLR